MQCVAALARRLRFGITAIAGLSVIGCASDNAKENPWHELEAIKLSAIARFVELETGDEEKATALSEQYYEEKKLVLSSLREGQTALVMASKVENAHVLDVGKFALNLRGDLTFWLLQNGCTIIDETIRATAGPAHVAVTGLGEQDELERGSVDESRIDLLLLEIPDGRRIELGGGPYPPPGKSLVILGDIRISGVCQ